MEVTDQTGAFPMAGGMQLGLPYDSPEATYDGQVIEHEKATAQERPCQLYTQHIPLVTRTQGHHVYPVYLQNRVFGKIVIPELIWLCGNCHDSTHEWISWLLREAREPLPAPPPRARALASQTYDWFTAAQALKADGHNPIDVPLRITWRL